MKSKFLYCMLAVFVFFTVDALAMPRPIQIAGDIDLNQAFYNIGALSTTVVIIVDFLKNKFPVTFQGNFLRWFSYLLPIALAYLAWGFKWGMFVGISSFWYVGLIGVVASVGAWFESYLGIANIILQFLGIDLKARRERLRNLA